MWYSKIAGKNVFLAQVYGFEDVLFAAWHAETA